MKEQESFLGGKPLDDKYLLHKLKTNHVIISQNSFPKYIICFKLIIYF